MERVEAASYPLEEKAASAALSNFDLVAPASRILSSWPAATNRRCAEFTVRSAINLSYH